MNREKLFGEISTNMENLFGDKLKKIILYGSYARNKQNRESDIDFLVLVDDTEENIRKARYRIADIMAQLSLNYNLLVSITEETTRHFIMYSEILPFYQNIRKEGVEIYAKKVF